MRILLVDDHALVRDGVRALLAQHPRAEVVGEAADADAARREIARLQPDLVLMDIGLREGHGIALAAELMATRPALAVLMLSMYDNPEYLHQALQAGARGYVLKDGPSSEILAAIDAVAAGGSYIASRLARPTPRGDESARPLLSERESEILAALARGLSSKQIAAEYDLSVRTVETHRQNIRRKLKIAGQAELIRYAVEHCQTPGAPRGPRSESA
ncbi:MAG TPA: response regulator transcription factor [Burkholderiaceae bacterium]|nr:response regulator transcription factor [Burkholderiaceae bacterium]HMY99168.1 response regulator transcription factor [Burkholderiaceae bacterium]HNB43821.1 response regulator transcription factor [Burkholderiaceae bacterium]HNG80153.1 response regulator transcription factor [Burkholderiaceae bacterium]